MLSGGSQSLYTDWASGPAYSHKDGGDLRVCLDPRHLNKALKSPHNRTPPGEELTHTFSKGPKSSQSWRPNQGGQYSSTPSLLTTFQSSFGRYCFQRLPFGLSVSQDIFQLRMDQILEQVDWTADDIAIYAKDEKEHDQVLHNLLRVGKESGLVFNSVKCSIKTDSVTVFGVKNDASGVHPDPEKLATLLNMATPPSKKELQTFLGFIQFWASFISMCTT